jgi:mRNA interferase MazF
MSAPVTDISSDFPHQGDIFDTDLEPVTGSEIGKRRPSLVVSNDINNRYSATVTILPVTSQASRKVYPFEVHVPRGAGGLTADSRIKANQIRTIDKRRLVRYRGTLPADYLPLVELALKVHLNMK